MKYLIGNLSFDGEYLSHARFTAKKRYNDAKADLDNRKMLIDVRTGTIKSYEKQLEDAKRRNDTAEIERLEKLIKDQRIVNRAAKSALPESKKNYREAESEYKKEVASRITPIAKASSAIAKLSISIPSSIGPAFQARKRKSK